MKIPLWNVVLGAIVLSLGSVLPAQGQTPAITSQVLPTLDMGIAIATTITDSGIVGGVAGSNGKVHAVRWQNGQITDLGNLCDTCIGVIVYDINSSGNVVGTGVTDAGVFRPVASIGTAVSELALPDGYSSGIAYDINDSGEIVGQGQPASGRSKGLRWASATSAPEVLPLYGAVGLSETGDVAGGIEFRYTKVNPLDGTTYTTCSGTRAALIRNGVVEEMIGPEMTGPDDECQPITTTAYAVNPQGLVAGSYHAGFGAGTRVAVWENSMRTLLEPLGGFKQSMPAQHPLNEFGDVAGNSSVPTSGSFLCYTVATAWLPEGQFALPSSEVGPCDTNAWAINKHAQIVGSYVNASGTLQLPIVWSIDVDRQDPEVTVAATTPNIAPPNRKMVPVTFTGTIVEEHLASASYAVTDEYGLLQPAGSISVSPSGDFSFTVMLEARRDGGDKDRVYTVVVTATDDGGRTGSASTTARVKPGKK